MAARRQPVEPPPTNDPLLTWKDLRKRVTLSRSTVQRLSRAGQFPRPIRLSPARVAWRESDIAAWIAKRSENTGSYVAD